MFRLLVSMVLLLLGSVSFWVYQPEVQGTATVASPTASLSPGNSPKVLRPSESLTTSQTAVESPTEALPTVSFSPHPTAEPSVSLIPRPTASNSIPVMTATPKPLGDGCYSVPVTPNTPTGIAGCIRFGTGTASFYTSVGLGAAMNFCTWTLRHTEGCGTVKVTSLATGLSVRVPIVDFCDCYTGTSRERIIDLQGGVLAVLGLNPTEGLFRVRVER